MLSENNLSYSSKYVRIITVEQTDVMHWLAMTASYCWSELEHLFFEADRILCTVLGDSEKAGRLPRGRNVARAWIKEPAVGRLHCSTRHSSGEVNRRAGGRGWTTPAPSHSASTLTTIGNHHLYTCYLWWWSRATGEGVWRGTTCCVANRTLEHLCTALYLQSSTTN